MGVKLFENDPKKDAAMKRLLQAVKDLGWSIAIEKGDGDQQVRGLLIGTEAYLNEFECVDE